MPVAYYRCTWVDRSGDHAIVVAGETTRNRLIEGAIRDGADQIHTSPAGEGRSLREALRVLRDLGCAVPPHPAPYPGAQVPGAGRWVEAWGDDGTETRSLKLRTRAYQEGMYQIQASGDAAIIAFLKRAGLIDTPLPAIG